MSEKQSSWEPLVMSENSPILMLHKLTRNKISDMTKVAIKNENITSFGGIYHIMDVFPSWVLGNSSNPYWVSTAAAARRSTMAMSFSPCSSATFVTENVLRTSS